MAKPHRIDIAEVRGLTLSRAQTISRYGYGAVFPQHKPASKPWKWSPVSTAARARQGLGVTVKGL